MKPITTSFMIKRLIIVSLVLFDLVSYAQCTDYYRLTRIQKNGTPNRNVSGGQFITFINSICFESDSKGDGVGHGYLSFSKEMSNSQFSIYKGSSYWGKATVFKFNSDKSILNVVLDNGDIYVYKRATAPAGQETCSLIRKPSSSSGNSGGTIVVTPSPVYPPQNWGGYDVGSSGTYNGGNSGNGSNGTTTQPKQHRCGLCGGSGEVIENNATSFGNTKYCSKCGKTVPDSHYHTICPSCKGKGWW